MDITLERILSLIPKKDGHKYVHGAKKIFAESIGYDSGDIVSMWEKGTSQSYRNKIHEISAKYNVSVEWLKGETDEKNPPPKAGDKEKLKALIETMSREELMQFISEAMDVLKEK